MHLWGAFKLEVGRLSRSASESEYGTEAQLLDEIRDLARREIWNLMVIHAEKTRQEAGFGAMHGAVIRVEGSMFECDDPGAPGEHLLQTTRVREFQGAFEGAWICDRSGTDATFGCRGPLELVEPKDVRVIDEAVALEPVRCGKGHEIEGRDGRDLVDGEREVAIERIREAAAERGWNVVVLDKSRETEVWGIQEFLDGSGRGANWTEVELFGKAYRCPSTESPSASERRE